MSSNFPDSHAISAESEADRRRAPRYGATLRPEARDVARGLKSGSGVISPAIVSTTACLLEFFVLLATGTTIFWLHVYPVEGLALHYIAVVLATPILAILAFQAASLYTIPALRNPVKKLVVQSAAWAILFAAIAVLAFLTQSGEHFSRVLFSTWFMVGLFALVVTRTLLFSLVRSWGKGGKLDRRAVIIGGGPNAEALVSALDGSSDADLQIVGIFDDRDDERSPLIQAGYRKLGTTDQLVEFVRMASIDLLIVVLPVTAETRLLTILKKLWVLPVDIRLAAHTNELRFKPRAYSYIGNIPFLDVADRPIGDWDRILKTIFDKVIAVTALIALSPVMITAALAVRFTSKGPVLFKQSRYGFNNELIGIYKFRSMYTDVCDTTASKLVAKGDPRVTAVGRFIRRTSIDELPQLFNVLAGELSLVGPRPHAVQAKAADALYNDVVDGYFARHRVKPGITGWAQINGWRGETDTRDKIERRVEHDLYYIENWSVFFDAYILALTPFRLLSAEGAY